MPVLVANASDIPSLLQRLEAHRLANPDTALQFVLLSDFEDADAEDMPTDDDITHALVSGVDELNKRYTGARGGGPFQLDRKSVVSGKSVVVRVDIGGRRN